MASSHAGVTSRGYRRVRANGHPYANGRRMVFEHVMVAERVMGKQMPPRAVVHHIDGNKLNNLPSNLVLCEDQAFHLLLHRRQRALEACGNPSWRFCGYCQQHDDPRHLTERPSGQTHHPKCAATWQAALRKSRPTRSGRVGPGWATETHCRHGHPWTPETIHFNRKGVRVCRACERERDHPHRQQYRRSR